MTKIPHENPIRNRNMKNKNKKTKEKEEITQNDTVKLHHQSASLRQQVMFRDLCSCVCSLMRFLFLFSSPWRVTGAFRCAAITVTWLCRLFLFVDREISRSDLGCNSPPTLLKLIDPPSMLSSPRQGSFYKLSLRIIETWWLSLHALLV